jgi:hypothetical protein
MVKARVSTASLLLEMRQDTARRFWCVRGTRSRVCARFAVLFWHQLPANCLALVWQCPISIESSQRSHYRFRRVQIRCQSAEAYDVRIGRPPKANSSTRSERSPACRRPHGGVVRSPCRKPAGSAGVQQLLPVATRQQASCRLVYLHVPVSAAVAHPWTPAASITELTPQVGFTVSPAGELRVLGMIAYCAGPDTAHPESLMVWSTVYDEVTGLHNRTYLFDQLALGASARSEAANCSRDRAWLRPTTREPFGSHSEVRAAFEQLSEDARSSTPAKHLPTGCAAQQQRACACWPIASIANRASAAGSA